jgi:hypothetical protein
MSPIAQPPSAFSAWIPAPKGRAPAARPAGRAFRNLSAQSAAALFRVRAGRVILKRLGLREHTGACPPSPGPTLTRRGGTAVVKG